MTMLEPFILLRIAAGIVATALFAWAARVGLRVLRHRSLATASEGRLALERQAELAGAFARVGAIVQAAMLLMTVVTADRLTGAVRGAMCGYGVVAANGFGWASLATTALTSVAAGVVVQLYAFDRRVRGLELLAPLAVASIAMAPLAALDLVLAFEWLGKLDLSAVASCCSTGLDEAVRSGTAYVAGPRRLATFGALALVPFAIGAALFASRRPERPRVALASSATLAALPLALGATVLEVAPYVYEVPGHLCPFCLLKADAWFLGYPLFGATFLALVWGVGAGVAALVARGPSADAAFVDFARSRMRREAIAWGAALALGVLPVALYTIQSPGASLFR